MLFFFFAELGGCMLEQLYSNFPHNLPSFTLRFFSPTLVSWWPISRVKGGNKKSIK